MSSVRPITPQDVTVYRDVRLRALQDTPSAFGSTYQRESRFTEEEWIARAARMNAEEGVGFLAMEGGAACGVVGAFRNETDPSVARLVAWNRAAVKGAKFDRDEISIYLERSLIRETCMLLRDDEDCPFNYLADVTCVDWFPSEPRFEVVYHLLSIPKKERVRLKVRLEGDSPALDSVTSVWPSANYFEREVFDLFGVRFAGHPYLRRLLMPEDWEGYPLRKDYPVEGYR